MNGREPRVSVIMPVYNSMPYLTGTMESLLAQDLGEGELEVIAVDDGSTDGSGEELDRFAVADGRVTVVHQPNSGWPGMPRNRGLGLARGRYLFFMDSDDTMEPETLRRLADMADAEGMDVVIPRMEGTGGRLVQSLFTKHPHGDVSIARAMETLSPQKLFRRDLVEAHALRFPEGRVRLEDGMFVTRAYLLARRIGMWAEHPLYYIAQRDDGQNISSRDIDPAGYAGSVRTIAEILREHVEDRDEADRLVFELFLRKGLRFYAPKRWLKMSPERQRRWMELHREYLADLVPAELDPTAPKQADRLKLELIRAGDAAAMDAVVRAAVALGHTATLVEVRPMRRTLELVVAVSARENAFAEQLAGPRAAWRRGLAGAARSLLAPLLDRRRGRILYRRIERALWGEQPLTLQLAGRDRPSPAVLAAILAPAGAGTEGSAGLPADAPRRSFIVPAATLGRYRGDIADAWTVARSEDGVDGNRERLRAGCDLPLKASVGRRRVRVYETNQGNASLDVRKG
ncbi:glycosyltransferase family 2 protein [Leucobacter sp. CSA1]|uniref:Glycosyltransferase family 2 protein n=1 Tax=Leucobacter chromiisoli TaxID=2796471 RepID=A0A934Q644_9MICO|nr:glycosyltransferase family 2 protein [Leucobacter chromiisoli]MBK0418346.1 glycosyltransferase family 2 protein [Leucobacter chromiisoli]